MKKTKMLALTLVVAIMLAGAGYAAWTDRIKVNNVIHTGEFEVTLESVFSRVFVRDETYDDPTSRDDEWISGTNPLDTASVLNPQPTIEENAVTFTFNNLYPGTRSWSHFYAENTGDVTAIVDNVRVVVRDEDATVLGEQMVASGLIEKRIHKSPTNPDRLGTFSDVLLDDLQDKLYEILHGEILEPGDILFFGSDPLENPTNDESLLSQISFWVPSDLTDDEGENETIEIEIIIDFVQYNLFDPDQPQLTDTLE